MLYRPTSLLEPLGFEQFGSRPSCSRKKCLNCLIKLAASILYPTAFHADTSVTRLSGDKGDFPEQFSRRNEVREPGFHRTSLPSQLG